MITSTDALWLDGCFLGDAGMRLSIYAAIKCKEFALCATRLAFCLTSHVVQVVDGRTGLQLPVDLRQFSLPACSNGLHYIKQYMT